MQSAVSATRRSRRRHNSTREGGRSAAGEDLSQPYVLRVRQPIWAFGRIDNSIAVANAEVSTRTRRPLARAPATGRRHRGGLCGGARQPATHRHCPAERDGARGACSRRFSAASRGSSRRARTRVWPRRGSRKRRALLRARHQRMGGRAATTWLGSRRWRSAPMSRCRQSCSSCTNPTDLIETAIDQSAEISLKQQPARAGRDGSGPRQDGVHADDLPAGGQVLRPARAG